MLIWLARFPQDFSTASSSHLDREHIRWHSLLYIHVVQAFIISISRSSTKCQAWRTTHQDLTNCSDEVQSWVLLFLCISFPTEYPNSSLVCFPVSKLGSDWLVCRKCIIHMLLQVIHYIYMTLNLSWLYAQGYTWFLIMIVIDSM